MPRKKSADKLTTLQEKIKQLKAQEAAILARQNDQARKDDTRRKVLAGALALEHWKKNPNSEFAAVLNRLMNEYLVRPLDRALFPSLPPLDSVSPPPSSSQTEQEVPSHE